MSVDQENPKNESNSEEQLPDWLREIRGEAPAFQSEADSTPELPPETESTVSEIEELPEWLQDEPEDFDEIVADVTDETVETVEAETDTVDAEAIGETETDLVDDETSGKEMWEKILAEEGVSLDDVPDERPEGAEDMSVKDWMIATADESAKRQAQVSNETSAWLDDTDEIDNVENIAETVEDDGMVLENDLPDWLKDDTVAEAEDDSVPSWLTDDSVVTKMPDTESLSDEIEETSETTETIADASAELIDEETAIDEDLPDWLKEDVVAEITDETAPAWLNDESVVSDTEAESVVETVDVDKEPILETAEETEFIGEEMVVDDDLPDWLKEDVITETADEDMPAWLDDESIISEVEEESIAEIAEVEAAIDLEAEAVDDAMTAELEDDEMIITEDLPDWLKEDAVADATDEDVPAWLSDESMVSELEEESVAEIVDDLVDEVVAEEPVPDWLEESDEEPVMTAQTIGEDEEPEPEVTAVEETVETVETDSALSETEAVLDESLSEEPEDAQEMLAETKTVLDQSLAEQVLSEDAIEPLRAALEVGQVDEALNGLSTLIEDASHLEDIVTLLSKNTDVYPDNPAIFETLGDAQMQLGQLSQAFQSYKTALQKL